jgi:hypothetical protein
MKILSNVNKPSKSTILNELVYLAAYKNPIFFHNFFKLLQIQEDWT